MNTSNGSAANLVISQPLPSGLSFHSQSVSLEGPDTGSVEAIDLGAIIFDSGSMSWTIADGDFLLPGQSLIIDITADVGSGTNTDPPLTSTITSAWGCDSETVPVSTTQTFVSAPQPVLNLNGFQFRVL